MTEITKKDCKKLYNDFIDFCEKQQPNVRNYYLFLFLDSKIKQTIEEFEKYDQSELRSMFRTILKVMGEDYFKYEEVVQ